MLPHSGISILFSAPPLFVRRCLSESVINYNEIVRKGTINILYSCSFLSKNHIIHPFFLKKQQK